MAYKKIIKVFFTIILCFIFIIYVLPNCSLAFGPSSDKIYQGIDVSIYQKNIDFKKVKQAGIEVVYIKASQGFSYIDPTFEKNYSQAKENGLKVGIYHYVTARTEEEAKRQAKFFVSLASGKTLDCKLAMDFEVFGDLTKEEINKVGLAFLREVEKLSEKRAILYSNAFTANTIWEGENTTYPLWIAEYDVEKPINNGTWKNWEGWQYSDIGIINGINGYVDRDQFTKEIFLEDTTQIPQVDDPNKEENNNGISPTPNKTIRITIKSGDTLTNLARKYNTTISELVRLNGITNPNIIYAGETMLVPIRGDSNQNDSNVEKNISDGTIQSNGNRENYTVKSGDTLSQIAQRFNTTVRKIAIDNNISNINIIFPGQVLEIKKGLEYETNGKLYTVRKGDTLWSISRRYNTSIANIIRLNRINNPNLIFPGQIFRI